MQSLSTEQILENYQNLPSRVMGVLHSPKELALSEKLEKYYKFDEKEMLAFNNFYLSVLFKINSPDDFVTFLKEKTRINDPNIIKVLLADFLISLYQYGDFILEIKNVFQKFNVPMPAERPLIETIRVAEDIERENLAAQSVSVSLSKALAQYPELGEQLITSDRITLKNFPSPVRPSIKNWLADYNFVVGFAKKEGSIGRTNYLFHNINTQKMSSPDRQKLSYILKAFDENSLITVNKNSQQVIFPDLQEKSPVPPVQKKFESPGKEKGGPDVRFTSPQKMPYEKEKDGTRQPYRITPFDTSPRDKTPDDNSQAPKNVINLKGD